MNPGGESDGSAGESASSGSLPGSAGSSPPKKSQVISPQAGAGRGGPGAGATVLPVSPFGRRQQARALSASPTETIMPGRNPPTAWAAVPELDAGKGGDGKEMGGSGIESPYSITGQALIGRRPSQEAFSTVSPSANGPLGLSSPFRRVSTVAVQNKAPLPGAGAWEFGTGGDGKFGVGGGNNFGGAGVGGKNLNLFNYEDLARAMQTPQAQRIRQKLCCFVGETRTWEVDSVFADPEVQRNVADFLKANNNPRIIFFDQDAESSAKEVDSAVTSARDCDGSSKEHATPGASARSTLGGTTLTARGGLPQHNRIPTLFLARLDRDSLDGRCIFFVRNVITGRSPTEIMCGSLASPLLDSIDMVIGDLHGPVLQSPTYDWNQIGEEKVADCLFAMISLREKVQEALSEIYGGTSLQPVPEWLQKDSRTIKGTYTKLALDDTALSAIEEVLEVWCGQIETMLADDSIDRTPEEGAIAGPKMEYSWWRKRVVKIGSVVEQLKGREARMVVGVVSAAKSRLLKRWRQDDTMLTDALNEAKDNTKHLAALGHFFEPLYSGNVAQMLDCLPGLFSGIRMLVSVTRHYSSARRLARMISRVATQTVTGCRRVLLRRGHLLDQDLADGKNRSGDCLKVLASFREHEESLYQRLLTLPRGRHHEFRPEDIMADLVAFEKRLRKVHSMLETIGQFSTLHDAQIEGMGPIKEALDQVLERLRRKPYDLLDTRDQVFEEDLASFEASIAEVEVELREFIENSFEEMQSTELALKLLDKLEVVLQRDSLRKDLADKYSLIFQYYGGELEAVQELYDVQKTKPPLARNMPPVSGNILWARHLLTKIEEPMQRFQSNKVISGSQESKRVIKLYNKMARTLVEFETLWFRAWERSVESSKEGLQATLICRHPEDPNRLCVNFDPQVTQLIREAKVMHRMGMKLSDQAQLILLQESKFSVYLGKLHLFLSEYNGFLPRIPSLLSDLVRPHLEFLERTVRPGLVNLTWASMNIDAYLHRIHQNLARINELIKQVQARLENANRNLKSLRLKDLVNLPRAGQQSLDHFVQIQQQGIQEKSYFLVRTRFEVEHALEDVLQFLQNFPTDTEDTVTLDDDAVRGLRTHYGHLFYVALRGSVKMSLKVIKDRLADRAGLSMFLLDRPFFDVDVELSVPTIALSPSLDDVQNSINECGRLVLSLTKYVPILTPERRFKPPNSLRRDDDSSSHSSEELDEVHDLPDLPSGNFLHNPSPMQTRLHGSGAGVVGAGGQLPPLSREKPTLEIDSFEGWPTKPVLGAETSSDRDADAEDEGGGVVPLISKRRAGKPKRDAHNLPRRRSSLVEAHGGPPNVSPRSQLKLLSTSYKNIKNLDNEAQEAVAEPLYPVEDTYYSLIAQEHQVVQSVLLLTGSIEGSKRRVLDYLKQFMKFEFLWTDDKNAALHAFTHSNPDLHDFEGELARYSQVESDISSITPYHNIGCMVLRTQSLKYSLQAESAAWKSQYSKILHKKASQDLEKLLGYLSHSSDLLSKDVSNVEEVAVTVSMLRDLNKREHEIEEQIHPIESMFYILGRYDVRLPKEEMDQLVGLRQLWRRLLSLGQERNLKLAQLQAGFKRDVAKSAKSLALEVMQFCNDFDMNGPMLSGLAPPETMERLHKYQTMYDKREEEVVALQKREALFGLVPSEFETLARVNGELAKLGTLYSLYERVRHAVTTFSELLWIAVPAHMATMVTTFKDFQKELQLLSVAVRSWQAYTEMTSTIESYLSTLPALEPLCDSLIRKRHWTIILNAANQTYPPALLEADSLKLKHVVALNPANMRAEIKAIAHMARTEADVERRVRLMGERWSDRSFVFADYKGRAQAVLDSDFLVYVKNDLEDSIMQLQGISAATRGSETLAEEVASWIDKLSVTVEVIDSWAHVQSIWMQVEAVFTSQGHSNEALAAETKRFQKVDANFQRVVQRAHDNRNVVTCCATDQQLRSLLPQVTEQLELSKHSLSQHLESKRARFPRLAFLSNLALLDMVSAAADSRTFLQHLPALSAGLRGFVMSESPEPGHTISATHIVCSEGAATERFPLLEPVSMDGGVDIWLDNVLLEAERTLQANLVEATHHGEMNGPGDLVEKYTCQVCVLAFRIQWTQDSYEALTTARFDKSAMIHTQKRNITSVDILTRFLQDDAVAPATRHTTQTIILVQVHQRDLFDHLVIKNCASPLSFDFVKMVRYLPYFDGNAATQLPSLAAGRKMHNRAIPTEVTKQLPFSSAWSHSGPQTHKGVQMSSKMDKDAERNKWMDDRIHSQPVGMLVQVAEVTAQYGFEILGLSQPIAGSASTDRCMLCLAQAAKLRLVGGLVGPEGVGKTETARGLAYICGRFAVTMACTRNMDAATIGRALGASLSVGSFAVFDALEAIPINVLSTVATLLHATLTVLREDRKKHNISGGPLVPVNSHAAVFCTMSPPTHQTLGMPASTQTVGSLPNLCTLLRTFAMPHQDPEACLAAHLTARGFETPRDLARKVAGIFRLAPKLLPGRPVDFSVGAALAVVRAADAMRQHLPGDTPFPGQASIYAALNQLTAPRYSMAKDSARFRQLLVDFFPGVYDPTADRSSVDTDLVQAVKTQARARNLDAADAWVDKIMQLHEALEHRQGVVLVGDALTGKTAMLDTLAAAVRAHSQDGMKCVLQRLNPKALRAREILGWSEDGTGTWHDGVLAAFWRRARAEERTTRTWLCLDGPIDQRWVETLSGALDTGGSLTLSSEGMPPAAGLRVVLEVDSMGGMAPTVAARVGVVWVSSADLPWRSFAGGWLEARGEEERATWRALFDRYIDEIMHFVKNQVTPAITVPHLHAIKMLTDFLTTAAAGVDLNFDETAGVFAEKVFLFCVCWAFGGVLETADRHKLSQHLYTITDLLPQMHGNTLFDYYPDETAMDWEPWASRVPDWSYPVGRIGGGLPFSDVVFPTPDSARTQHILRALAMGRADALVTGKPGSTKSSALRDLSTSLKSDGCVSMTLTLSKNSTPTSLLNSILTKLSERQGRLLGPEGGKTLMVVVDDIGFAPTDEWGDRPICEALRHLLQEGGYHASDSLSEDCIWRSISGVFLVAVMSHPSATGRGIPQRLMGRLDSINIPVPDDEAVAASLFKVLDAHLNHADVDEAVAEAFHNIPAATMALCAQLRETFHLQPNELGAAFKTFNLHDVSRLFSGLLLCPFENLQTGQDVVNLWRHEVERSLVDRLPTEEQQDAALHRLFEVMRNPAYFPNVDVETCIEDSDDVFGTFLSDDSAYTVLPEVDTLQSLLEHTASAHGVLHPLHTEAVMHVVRIARMLALVRSSLAFVGPSSSGRSSLTRIAAFLFQAKVLTPGGSPAEQNKTDQEDKNPKEEEREHAGGWEEGAVLEALQAAYKDAGVLGLPVVLLLKEDQLQSHEALGAINELICTGQLPDHIFSKMAITQAVHDMRTKQQAEQPHHKHGGHQNHVPVMAAEHFVARAWENLHVVICPSSPEELDSIAANFPGVARHMFVEWFHPWSEQATLSVAIAHLADLPSSTTLEVENVATYLAGVHRLMVTKVPDLQAATGRRSLSGPSVVGPSIFAVFAGTFQSILARREKELRERADRMQSALGQLRAAGNTVADMKAGLSDQNAQLSQAQLALGAMLLDISSVTTQVEKQKATVVVLKNRVAEKVQENLSIRDEVDREEASAAGAWADAVAIITALPRRDVDKLKRNKNPPAATKMVFDVLLILMDRPIRPVEVLDGRTYRDTFTESLALISDIDFPDMLLEYTQEMMTLETAELIAPYLEHRDFSPAKIGALLGPAGEVTAWILALARYREIAGAVVPRIKRLRQAEWSLDNARKKLAKAERECQQRQANLDGVQEHFEQAMAKKQRLQQGADASKAKLELVTMLLLGLQEERRRWIRECEKCEEEIETLPGDAGIAAAMITYLGPLTRDQRFSLLQLTSECCHEARVRFSPELHITKLFTSHYEVSRWLHEGLPADEFSIQNGVLALYAPLPPLLIDPQQQAMLWLRAKLNPVLMHLSRPLSEIAATIEDCLTTGRPLMLLLVGSGVPGALLPFLDQLSVRQSKSVQKTARIPLTGREIDWHPAFRLFFQTTNANPILSSALSSRTSVIDFRISTEGIESKLLTLAVMIDHVDLHNSRYKSMQEVNEQRQAMESSDSELLGILSDASGDLLQDDACVNQLSKAKSNFKAAAERLLAAEEEEARSLELFEEYRAVAARGALLFEASTVMAEVNPIYAVSRLIFDQLFEQIIRSISTPGSLMPLHMSDWRRSEMVEAVTNMTMRHLSLGYLSKDHHLFQLLAAVRIHTCQVYPGIVDDLQAALSRCGAALDYPAAAPRKPHAWLPEAGWLNLICLASSVPHFRNLLDELSRGDSKWKAWWEKEAPELEDPPLTELELDPFHRLLLIRALREDRLAPAAESFVTWVLSGAATAARGGRSGTVTPERSTPSVGVNNPRPPWVPGRETDVAYLSTASLPRRPVLMFTVQGTDPTYDIKELARRRNIHLHVAAAGVGTTKEIINSFLQGVHSGMWMLVHNLHVAPDLMDALTEALQTIEPPPTLAMASGGGLPKNLQPVAKPAVVDPNLSLIQSPNKRLLLSRTTPEGDGGVNRNRSAAVHPDFRLWITANSTDKISDGMFLVSVRAICEPPQSIRACLRELYHEHIFQESLQAVPTLSAWPKLLYGLSLIYAVMIQRSKYPGCGWSNPLDVTIADWRISTNFAQDLLNEYEGIGGSSKEHAGTGPAWEAMRYIITNVHLGGLIPDYWDKRILTAYVGRVCSEEFLSRKTATLFGLSAPDSPELEEHHFNINMLPESNSAASLGLHTELDNAMVVERSREAVKLLVSQESPQHALLAEGWKAQVVIEIASNMQSKLPAAWQGEAKGQLGKATKKTPLSEVLLKEIDCMHATLTNVHQDLITLLQATQDGRTPDGACKELLDGLFDARTPAAWKAVSWDIPMLGEWLSLLFQSNEQLHKWNLTKPKAFWLPGLFYPSALFLAVQQEGCVSLGASLEQMKLQVQAVGSRGQLPNEENLTEGAAAVSEMTSHKRAGMMGQVDPSPAQSFFPQGHEGILISGLMVEGASWNSRTGRLAEQTQRLLFSPMPNVAVWATKDISEDNDLTERSDMTLLGPSGIRVKDPSKVVFGCPCYSSAKRGMRHHLFDMAVWTENPQTVTLWILRGVALLASKH